MIKLKVVGVRFPSDCNKEIASGTGRANLLGCDKIGEIHDGFTMKEFEKEPLRFC